MFKDLSRDAKFRIFLAILCALGVVLVLITTSRYGAGVSSDAARNLSTADSLLQGKGYVDMLGQPFLLWPPLYPALLAGLSLITGLGTFDVGWYLNVVLLAVNIWLSGWLLYVIFRDKPWFAVFGSLVVLVSRSLLRIHANVASEPLFETFVLGLFLAAAAFLRSGGIASLWAIFVLAGLATLQRYLGVVAIGVAVIVAYSRFRLPEIRRAILPAAVSILPIAAWALLHNYPISGTFFGPRDLGAMFPLQNISLSLTKILWWFIPRLGPLDFLVLHPWIPLVAAAAVLVAINRRSDWLSWLQALSDPYLWPGLLFSVVYFFLLAFTVVTADHLDLTSDRYYVLILPIVIALVLITLDRLVLAHIKTPQPLRGYALAGVALVWFIYPVYSLQAYLRQALIQGEPTNYNIANSANFREMSVVKAGERILSKDPSALIYSNYVNIVWFIYRHPVETLPFEDPSLSRDQRLAALRQYYPAWPTRSGYVIWFIPNQYHYVAPPEELATLANLQLLYSDKTGQIYYVAAKSP